MIPKIIHYCWFGHNPKPKLAKKCVKSWKKYCPDYRIIEWNEDNFDISACPLYVRQAYEAKMWAFVTDYARLKIVYENGGIYLDTDVELIKSLDAFLEHDAFFGFEDGIHIATGLGFGAAQGHYFIKELMDDYNYTPFILKDGSYNTITCPVKNTAIFLKHGLKQDNSRQSLCNVQIFPKDYFCPMDYNTNILNKTKNTYSIHRFSASWVSPDMIKQQKKNARKHKRLNLKHKFTHIPHLILRFLLGSNYEKLKQKIKND